MSIQMKEEYLMAGIRQQAKSLHSVIQEMGIKRLPEEGLSWRLKAVELQLRRMRESIESNFSFN